MAAKKVGTLSGCAMTDERIALLEGIGFEWSVRKAKRSGLAVYKPGLSWEERLEQLKEFKVGIVLSVFARIVICRDFSRSHLCIFQYTFCSKHMVTAVFHISLSKILRLVAGLPIRETQDGSSNRDHTRP
jgi:hypothetical protein